MSNRPDGSYATKDLFLQHPEHTSWYKYVGRLDDTLTQTLGEKTNPGEVADCNEGNSLTAFLDSPHRISDCALFDV